MRAVTPQPVDYRPGLLYTAILLGLAVLCARDGRKARRIRYAPDRRSSPSNDLVCSSNKRPILHRKEVNPGEKRDLSDLE